MKLTIPALTRFCAAIFAAAGLGEDDALTAADNLVAAEASGLRTHGLARLGAYVETLERGAINSRPEITVHLHGATGIVDGDNGLGPVVAHRAMMEAIHLARASGIGLIAVRRSNHFGAAGHFARMAIEHGMLGLVMSNASATVAPPGAYAPAFGTNPLAFAAPSAEGPPFLLDMATSVASRGQLRLAKAEERPIPPDWAVTVEGIPAVTAAEALDGALFPFGGAKGYGIALMAEILSSMLSGSLSGRDVTNFYKGGERPAGVGHAFLAIDIAAFRTLDAFTAHYDQFARSLRNTPPIEGESGVRMPGEGRAAVRIATARDGVTLSDSLLAELNALSGRLGVAPPARFAGG